MGEVWDTQAEFDQGFLMMGFGNEVRMIQVEQWGKGEPGGAGLVPTKRGVETVKSRFSEPAFLALS